MDGSGAGEATLPLEIPPRFYQTEWFQAGAWFSALALALLALRHRSRIESRRTAELEARVAERTEDLESARAAAEEASRVKSDFLAAMSHEFRTPMNGVLGIAELLSGTNLDEEQNELLATLRISGECLLALVNDVLDLSKIDSGHLQLECIPVSMEKLASDIVKLVRPMALKKRLDLRVTTSGQVIEWIQGDPTRIRQVLLNLLSNAIKFTDAGGIEVEIAWCAGEVRITVKDSGIGIPPEKIPLLFRNFSQVDSSTTRLYGGTGLGLAISRRLVEAMGGTVFCESAVNEGSEFTIVLPAIPVEPPAQALVPAAAGSLGGIRVLVAEDNLTNQKVILGLLRKLGIDAVLAANGQKAVEECIRQPFDLVLMDCQMPILDGYEATKAILRELGDKAPPVVALTAHSLESDREKCLAIGMRGYLAKPIRLSQLRVAINQHCHRVVAGAVTLQ